MSQNRFLYFLVAFVVIVTSFYLWKLLPIGQKTEVRKIYRTTTPPQTTPTLSTSKMRQQDSPSNENNEGKNPSSEALTSPDAKVRRWLRTMSKAKASYSPEELAEKKRYFEVLESPGYLELVRNGASMDERWNFMADAGLEVTRNISQVFFRGTFPSGAPSEYEPQMREKLSALIIEKGILDFEVLSEFTADPRVKSWVMGYFRGDYDVNGEYVKWLGDVSRQALTPDPTQRVSETTAPPKTTESFHDANTPPAPTERSPEDERRQLAEVLKQFQQQDRSENKGKHVQMPDVQASELPTNESQVPELPTNESFEKNLRDAFSPPRFKRAIETLNRYGSKEGLRRLKESDPEVAKHIERLLPRDQENDR